MPIRSAHACATPQAELRTVSINRAARLLIGRFDPKSALKWADGSTVGLGQHDLHAARGGTRGGAHARGCMILTVQGQSTLLDTPTLVSLGVPLLFTFCKMLQGAVLDGPFDVVGRYGDDRPEH